MLPVTVDHTPVYIRGPITFYIVLFSDIVNKLVPPVI